MPQFTKYALIEAFFSLAEDTPLEKITVTDVAAKCGVTRNTFYYYFKDIYDLLQDVLLEEANKVIDRENIYRTWSEAFLDVADFVLTHRKAAKNIYYSIGRDQLEKYLSTVVDHEVMRFIRQQAKGLDADEKDLRLIADFNREAFLGILINWLKQENCEEQDSKELIHRLDAIFGGEIRTAIERSVQVRKQETVPS